MKTLKIKVALGSEQPYLVDTDIQILQDNEYYYLPTDYKEPLKVKLVDYNINLSVNNIIRIMACIDIGNLQLEEVSPNLLFSKKDTASDYYLEHKKELNWDYLFKSEVE